MESKKGRIGMMAALAAAATLNPTTPVAQASNRRQNEDPAIMREVKKIRRKLARLTRDQDPIEQDRLLAAAAAKRERKDAKRYRDHTLATQNYYRGPWAPHPAHNKPSYAELMAAR